MIDGYMLRHKVRPGITGWAQVNGFRGETETVDKMKRRVEYDLEYLRNWSLRLDIDDSAAHRAPGLARSQCLLSLKTGTTRNAMRKTTLHVWIAMLLLCARRRGGRVDARAA